MVPPGFKYNKPSSLSAPDKTVFHKNLILAPNEALLVQCFENPFTQKLIIRGTPETGRARGARVSPEISVVEPTLPCCSCKANWWAVHPYFHSSYSISSGGQKSTLQTCSWFICTKKKAKQIKLKSMMSEFVARTAERSAIFGATAPWPFFCDSLRPFGLAANKHMLLKRTLSLQDVIVYLSCE